MKKSVWITIITILLTLATIAIILKMYENKKPTNQGTLKNEVEISSHKITDDCLNEIQEENIETANRSVDEDKEKYILRNNDGYICVYMVNNQEEKLYKSTDISTDYLAKEDVKNLENGIEVEGIENLNKLLEDFE